MASRLEIINESLALLQEDPIEADILAASDADLDTGDISRNFDEVAATVASVYPGAKRRILAAHPWSFLIERRQLVSSGAPVSQSWPFPHQFRQPDAVGQVRAMFDRSEPYAPPRVGEWAAHGSFLYTNFTPAWADFLHSDRAVEDFPPLVVDALQAELTARLTMPLKEDEPTARFNRAVADRALMDALGMDAQAHPVVSLTGFGYVEAHLGGGG